MRKFIYLLPLVLFVNCKNNNPSVNDYPISAVNITNVKIEDDFWLPKIRTIHDTTIRYAFEKCRSEGRMDNFLIAGGKMSGKTKGKMPFDDTDLYKIIEGASYSLISYPDTKLDAYLDSVIDIIKVGQEPDGYLTTWFTIDPQNPPATWVEPAKERWEKEISSHELYNSGHLFEAAAAHYFATGKRNFLDIALKNADLLAANFNNEKNHKVPGHQIVETGLVKLYRITGEQKYLDLAKFFLDQRGNAAGHELYGAYNQDHKPVVQQDEVTGHAVRGVYMYAGMTDIAALYKDTAYLSAVIKLWENMVNKKLYITGGLGARHEGESFGDNYELPNLSAYSETCAAIGSVYWNHRLFLLSGDAKYYNLIERTLYNSVISGISLDGTTFFYPNPLEADGKYEFNHGSCTRQAWFDCSCCPTNLIRFIPSIPGLIYAVRKDTIYTNLYISGTANIPFEKNSAEIIQKSNYPWDGGVTFIVNPEKNNEFVIKFRIPSWTTNQPVPGNLYSYIDENKGTVLLEVNNVNTQFSEKNGYIEIKRKWKTGDKVEITFPMEVRRVKTNENVASNKNCIAIEYGPFVYCAEQTDNGDLSGIKMAKSSVMSVEKKDLIDNASIIKYPVTGVDGKNKDIVLVPYYVWSNRGVGQMKVWFPVL